MEHKNLKTSVITTETIFNESAEQPIDIDFTLPEYYCDISKILKCRAVPRIASKGVNGSNITVEGCVTITVIYCGSDDQVSSYEYQYPFSKSFDSGMNTEGVMLNVKSKCEYINCRAVTGRKIDIHGAVGVYVNLTRRKVCDVVSDFDDCNVELLRGSIPATVPMGCADKYLTLEEEIEIGSAQPDVRCIIRYDAEATITDSKILAGKSVVKGDMLLKILYAPEGSSVVQKVRCQLPFSQLIEIDGLNDECDCESKVSIAHLEVKPRVSATGECRQFLISAKLLVTSECCCNNDVAVILDAYSRKYEADICKKDVCFNKICENVKHTFSCKKNIEFGDGAISSVSDMWCEVHTDKVKFSENNMSVTGSVAVFIIALDNDSIPVFCEKSIDFEYCHPMNIDGEFKCLPEITVTDMSYTLTGECNMELRVELNICASIYKCSNMPLITEIKVDNNKPLSKTNGCAMTVYFADKGENVWTIARKYFANVDEVRQINDITDDALIEDKMILIPIN